MTRLREFVMPTWSVAGVQFDCQFKQPDKNLETMRRYTRELAGQGAKLIVFPECALPGYCFASKADAVPFAEPLPGPSSQAMASLCKELGVFVIYGLLERDGERLFNAVALVGPNGLVGSYRKAHLPFLGVDRFVTPGDRPFQVFDIDGLYVGMLICYDGGFPEATRVLALLGADLVVLPTNWPQGALCSASHIPEMRAHENHIYFMCVNRAGSEGGFRFIGLSRLCDWNGQTLAGAASDGVETFVGKVDPEQARQKRVINKPGEYELDRLANRRPDLYGPLVAPVRE
jgi:predicted amidohydrolase